MAHPRWRAGKLSTGFITEEYRDGFRNPAPEGESAKLLAAVAVAIDHKLGQRKRRISGQLTGRAVTRATSRRVWLDTKEYTVEVAEAGAVQFGDGEVGLVPANGDSTLTMRYRGAAGGGANDLITVKSCWKPGDPVWSGTVDGQRVAVQARPVRNGYILSWRGAFANAQVYTEREANYARLMPVKAATDSGKKLLCPMPGLVKAIAVAEGQEVKVGETLAIVEAMKMENVLRAERDGTVKKLHAKAGDSLAVDAVIMEFA
jgi:propionyl-CoA carboxylase alpha chain